MADGIGFIVVRDGQNHQHKSYESALKEAERLCGKLVDLFTVYRPVTIVKPAAHPIERVEAGEPPFDVSKQQDNSDTPF